MPTRAWRGAQSILMENPESRTLTRVPEGEHVTEQMVVEHVVGAVGVQEVTMGLAAAEITDFCWFKRVPPKEAALWWAERQDEAAKIADAYTAEMENKVARRFLLMVERRKLEEELNEDPGGPHSNWSSRNPSHTSAAHARTLPSCPTAARALPCDLRGNFHMQRARTHTRTRTQSTRDTHTHTNICPRRRTSV